MTLITSGLKPTVRRYTATKVTYKKAVNWEDFYVLDCMRDMLLATYMLREGVHCLVWLCI